MNNLPHVYQEMHGTLRSYLIGFALSIILTLIAYFFVVEHVFSNHIIDYVLAALCIVQVVIQLVFFLHLGNESKPYWNFIVFSFMLSVILILVIGSLWIMYNLNYRTMADMSDMQDNPSHNTHTSTGY